MEQINDSDTAMAAAMSSSVQPMDSSSCPPLSPTKRQQESETDLPEPQAKKQKVTETFKCDVCSVECNGESGYERHMSGKRHRKNMNISLNASKMEQDSSQTDFPEPKAENKEITATFHCDVCSVDCLGESGYERHISGKKHCKKMNISPQAHIANKTQQDSSETNLPDPKAENKKITAAFQCDVCAVSCVNESGFDRHMSGKNHRKKMNISENKEVTATATFQCDVCSVDCRGQSGYERHMSGKNHRKKISSRLIPSKMQQDLSQADLPDPKAENKMITATFQCDVCSVFCTNESGYERHMSGKNHRKKMNISPQAPLIANKMKQDSSQTDLPDPKAENEISTATFRCDVCSVACCNKSGFERHMSGKNHRKNVIKMPQDSSQSDLPEPEAKNKEITEFFRCDVCTVEYSNKSGYELHMLGKMHLKKMNQFDAINAAVSSTCSSHLSTLSTPETSTVSMTGKTSTAVSVVSSVVSTVVSSMTETSSTMSTDVPEKLD